MLRMLSSNSAHLEIPILALNISEKEKLFCNPKIRSQDFTKW